MTEPETRTLTIADLLPMLEAHHTTSKSKKTKQLLVYCAQVITQMAAQVVELRREVDGLKRAPESRIILPS